MKRLVCALGAFLIGSLLFAQTELWGLTASNGIEAGHIFKTDGDGNNYTDVFTFTDTINGIDPHGSLIMAFDGHLYGLTHSGGEHNLGTVFRFDRTTASYTKVHDFDGTNGQHPFGALLEAANGKLYGMTHSGGDLNRGVLFSYDITTDSFSKLIDFDMVNGGHPYGSLMEADDGLLYGLSSKGGGDATGALFQFDPATGTIDHLHSFVLGPSGEGYDPHGSLIQTSDGHLYGFSRYGEPGFENGGGVVFEYDLTAPFWEAFTTLHRFDEDAPTSENGYELLGSPIQANDGKLYGMCTKGGSDSSGTIFSYDFDTDTLTKLYDFNPISDGHQPHGTLVQTSNGKMYGLTTSEGDIARLFEYDISTASLTIKATVTGTPYFTTLLEVEDTSTGVATPLSRPSLQLFPNPAQDYLQLKIQPGIVPSHLEIINAKGNVVKHIKPPLETVSVTNLPEGVYTLNVHHEGGEMSAVFIVRR